MSDPRNRRVVDGGVLPRAGRDPGRPQAPSRRACESKDQYEFQRVYPSRPSTPTHRLLLVLRPDRHRARPQNSILSGDDSRLFVNRVIDLLSNGSPRAAASS